MDHDSRVKLLGSVAEHFRTYYESAQQRFPNALVMLSRGESISSLREISNIKPDLLTAIKNLKTVEVRYFFDGLDLDTCPYHIQHLHRQHLLYRDVPEGMLAKRENLRRTGYVVMGHAQEARRHERYGFQGYLARTILGDMAMHRSSTYMSHLTSVFENAREISNIQADSLGADMPYDANLQDFTPGITSKDYGALLDNILNNAINARNKIMDSQTGRTPPTPPPTFSFDQGQELVRLINELYPIHDPHYETHLLDGIPSMCMGNIATIRFSPNPLILAETAFHERIGHLVYRKNADNHHGIHGFQMDEARALSLERFLLREESALAQLSTMMRQAYGKDHEAFAPENIIYQTKWIEGGLPERVSCDDLTYIIQEVIRGRTEMDVMNGTLKVAEMPDYIAAETERALGLTDLNGYHIMRETFQWPLCMQGHLAAYPQGITIAAQLHQAAKKNLGNTFTDFSQREDAPYFTFMREKIDTYGASMSGNDIVKNAAGEDYLNFDALAQYMKDKITAAM